jgi:hypothetical protein
MSKTIRTGYLLPASAGTTLHTAAGRLIAVLINNTQATVQWVTFYDATAATPGTEIMVLSLPPNEPPFYIQFPRDQAVPFGTGLHAVVGTCDVLVWTVDHG